MNSSILIDNLLDFIAHLGCAAVCVAVGILFLGLVATDSVFTAFALLGGFLALTLFIRWRRSLGRTVEAPACRGVLFLTPNEFLAWTTAEAERVMREAAACDEEAK